MSRKTRYPKLKAELKQLARDIRVTRIEYKEQQRAGNYKKYIGLLWSLNNYKKEFRHKHIAYCLLHGTPMEKIESSTSPFYDPPITKLVEEAMEKYGKNVCACA